MNGSPVKSGKHGTVLFVKVTPGASRNIIRGLTQDCDGQCYLYVGVTAVAENDKANTAVVKLLSNSLHLPKSAFQLMRGATSRLKQFSVNASVCDLKTAIGDLTKRQKEYDGKDT